MQLQPSFSLFVEQDTLPSRLQPISLPCLLFLLLLESMGSDGLDLALFFFLPLLIFPLLLEKDYG